MSGELHVDRPAEGVLRIVIDNPPANALGEALRGRLMAALDAAETDLGVRCLILTGTGGAFCSGDDLREARGRGEGAQASLNQFGRLLDAVERLRAPVIAAVNGYAIGGGLELALCCDIRIASEAAFFQGAGVNVGLMASVYRLPRLIGVGPAKAMLLTGERTDAATALRFGLVTALHPAADLAGAAVTLATRIATRAPLSVEASKRMIGQAFDLDARAAGKASGAELRSLAASADHKAALAAFARRETPAFTRS
ncbi:MAG TPA: enoyl-CoA hydratase-related protein [Caulobacteraceae bacterium]|jgi:enoyl-CoA hydratase/carnithine racemase|nr:enoyl-CoA hydratase-related protein [Caulobacteraceae bacterium]